MPSPDKTVGCQSCGLIGCGCSEHADLKESFAHLCKKCSTEPCSCDSKPMKTSLGDVCLACRRHVSLCICASHHPVKTIMADQGSAPTRPKRPFDDHHIDRMVNEAMNYYYQRDADGLGRWLRRVLP